MRHFFWKVPVTALLLGACATSGSIAPRQQTGNSQGSGCASDGDCASPLYCSSITNTCEPTELWCDVAVDCQQALGDPGARCIDNACWGTGVNCVTLSCKQGYGCESDADCDSGYTCSTGNGVCLPKQQPPSQTCSGGLVWNSGYDNGAGGCVAPADWPPATTQCGQDSHAPPTCLLCANIYAQGLRCPDHYGYLYGYMGNFYCCLDPPY